MELLGVLALETPAGTVGQLDGTDGAEPRAIGVRAGHAGACELEELFVIDGSAAAITMFAGV